LITVFAEALKFASRVTKKAEAEEVERAVLPSTLWKLGFTRKGKIWLNIQVLLIWLSSILFKAVLLIINFLAPTIIKTVFGLQDFKTGLLLLKNSKDVFYFVKQSLLKVIRII
jgi:hypothetical protein